MWTIYDSPKVYNAFPKMDSDDLRQAMQSTPFLYAPFYDIPAVQCCSARALKMAKVQAGQLPFQSMMDTGKKAGAKPLSGPLPAHKMTQLVRVGAR